jgi:hypothetical protein
MVSTALALIESTQVRRTEAVQRTMGFESIFSGGIESYNQVRWTRLVHHVRRTDFLLVFVSFGLDCHDRIRGLDSAYER